eukprot:9644559-Lingulodinium_polyedra.AAC.1
MRPRRLDPDGGRGDDFALNKREPSRRVATKVADASRGHPSSADYQNNPSDEEITDNMEAPAES